MAGLTKTQSDLPLPNLVRNPQHMPQAFTWTYLSDEATTMQPHNQPNFWTSWSKIGTYSYLNNTNTYYTALNISNSSKPIIVSMIMGNGSASTLGRPTWKITVDGLAYEWSPPNTNNYSHFRHTMGGNPQTHLYSTSSNTGGYKMATGLNEGPTYPTDAGNAVSRYMSVETATDALARGQPVLYCEHSFKVELKCSYNVGNSYGTYFGAVWQYYPTANLI